MKTISLKFAGCAALLALGLNAGAGVAKIGEQEYDTLNDAIAAAAEKGTVIELLANITTSSKPLFGTKELTIKGASKDISISIDSLLQQQSAKLTFDSLTVLAQSNANNRGIQTAVLILKNCEIKGEIWTYAEDFECYNCQFTQVKATSGNRYSFYVYGSDFVKLDTCVFNVDGKAVKIAKDGDTTPVRMVATGCKFNSSLTNKNAFMFDTRYSEITAIVTDCEFDEHFTSAECEGGKCICWDEYRTSGQNKFDGFVAVGANAEYDENFNITSGTFTELTNEDNRSIVAEGSTVTKNADGTWTVSGPSKEIEIEPVTKDETKGITQDVVDEINNNTEVKKIVQSGVNDALANIDPAGEAVVKVNLEKVEKATDEAETPTLTFEVAPYVGEVKVEDVNKKLNGKKVTVVLPLTKAFTVSAIVTHEDDPDRLLPVLGLPDNPYVRLETTHFSEFTATPSNQRVSSTEVDAKTVLGIKRVKEMSKSVDTAAAVPWMGAAGGDCKVSELITTGLAMGDTIKVYDLTTKGYFIWVVDKDGKTWVKVSDAPASQPEANEYTLARGRAFWYMKDGGNESDEYTQIGTYSTDQILTTIDKGVSFAAPVHNLLINPKWTAFNIQEKLTAAVGCAKDDVVVIVETGKRYRFDGTTWGQDVSKQTTDRFGRTITTTVFEAIGTGDGVVSAGTAFWYLSAGGVPTIAW